MIKTEDEYKVAKERLAKGLKTIEEQRKVFKTMELSRDEVKRALDPLISFHDDIKDEIEAYEKMKCGDIGEFINLNHIGRALIALRLAKGLTQSELAERLGVDASQVSRDERNEYAGITLDRANRILECLKVTMRSNFDEPVRPDSTPNKVKK